MLISRYYPPIAGVAEWYTHAIQNRAPKGLRVQVPSPAQCSEAELCRRGSQLLGFRKGLEGRSDVPSADGTARRGRENSERRRGIICDQVPNLYMQNQKLLVILGPTSSGKTALSISLAKKYNGEIISADSRQVYKGMNLGTGKVTKKEMAGIPHHLLDVANPKKIFTNSDFCKLAEKAIDDIFSRGKLPIICGGTGFYIDTLVNGMVFPEVQPNPSLRKKLSNKSAPELVKILAKLDPIRVKTIEQKNPVRLIRAIEIATALGKVPKIVKKKVPYTVLKIGLDMDDETLKKRINVRLKERIKGGMLREAKTLHTKGISWKRMKEFGLEYRAMANLQTGEITKEEFEPRLQFDIWHYAKRQRVWFKRDKKINWFNPLKKENLRKINSLLEKFLT